MEQIEDRADNPGIESIRIKLDVILRDGFLLAQKKHLVGGISTTHRVTVERMLNRIMNRFPSGKKLTETDMPELFYAIMEAKITVASLLHLPGTL